MRVFTVVYIKTKAEVIQFSVCFFFIKDGGYAILFFIPESVKKANSLCEIYALTTA